jgi:hypothetical protein
MHKNQDFVCLGAIAVVVIEFLLIQVGRLFQR